MSDLLTFPEARALGCLLEKEMATPEYYPMTVNSLVAACNQSSNRDPVVAYEEATVDEALAGLRRKKLAAMLHLAGSRAPKYKHLAREFFPGLDRPELAILAVLTLRGPQTVAELRTRTERLHTFPDAPAVESALERLTTYQSGPLVSFQPPGHGRRAATYTSLLTAPAASAPTLSTPSAPLTPAADWRTTIESHLATLESRIAALEQSLRSPPPS
jgi:uncharacterized protein YceH (UPF0502 family)